MIAGFLNNDRIRRSADRLATDLRLAQSEAIQQQRTVEPGVSTGLRHLFRSQPATGPDSAG